MIGTFQVQLTLQSMLLTQTQNQLKSERAKKKKSSRRLLPAGKATVLTADEFYDATKAQKEKVDAERAAKVARWQAKAAKRAQRVFDATEKARLKADWKARVVAWEVEDQKLRADGVKGKDRPPRPRDPTRKGYKHVPEDIESSSESELASDLEEESESGWISGDSENDGSEDSFTER